MQNSLNCVFKQYFFFSGLAMNSLEMSSKTTKLLDKSYHLLLKSNHWRLNILFSLFWKFYSARLLESEKKNKNLKMGIIWNH